MFIRRAPVLLMLLCAASAEAADPPALARARALYNAADYDGAIAAAAAARLQPGSADAAALVAARAHLERYGRRATPGATAADQEAASADLAAAREALAAITVTALTPRDRVDLLVGLGESLYLGDQFGAAAEMFDTALGQGTFGHDAVLPARDRVLLLDWWASALDREAQNRSPERRAPIFERIVRRMEEELRQDPWSATANYWLAVASRGTGDVDRAWDAAVAGWVRSSLTPQGSETLRADLDRLVTQALIPERARVRPAREQAEAAIALGAEWDQVKEQWK